MREARNTLRALQRAPVLEHNQRGELALLEGRLLGAMGLDTAGRIRMAVALLSKAENSAVFAQGLFCIGRS